MSASVNTSYELEPNKVRIGGLTLLNATEVGNFADLVDDLIGSFEQLNSGR